MFCLKLGTELISVVLVWIESSSCSLVIVCSTCQNISVV